MNYSSWIILPNFLCLPYYLHSFITKFVWQCIEALTPTRTVLLYWRCHSFHLIFQKWKTTPKKDEPLVVERTTQEVFISKDGLSWRGVGHRKKQWRVADTSIRIIEKWEHIIPIPAVCVVPSFPFNIFITLKVQKVISKHVFTRKRSLSCSYNFLWDRAWKFFYFFNSN